MLILPRGPDDDRRDPSPRYRDGEIVEIVSNVALNILRNYINHVAQTQVDFPRVDVAIKNAV